MKIAKEASLQVLCVAWRRRSRLRRPFTKARTSAPDAPIAPPSEGVATPRKIEPSTRTIRASGGSIASATRRAKCARPPKIRRHGRGGPRPHDRDREDVERVEGGEHERRPQGRGEDVDDRDVELIGKHDEHDARRDHLREGARCRDHAGGERPIIAVAHHDRERDQPHRDHRGGDHSRHRREQGADHDDRIAEAAAHRAEELAHGLEEVLGEPRAFEDHAHEDEEGNGEQNFRAHDAEHALRQRVQEIGPEQMKRDADGGEDEAGAGEREGDGVTGKQERHEGEQHHGRHIAREPFGDRRRNRDAVRTGCCGRDGRKADGAAKERGDRSGRRAGGTPSRRSARAQRMRVAVRHGGVGGRAPARCRAEPRGPSRSRTSACSRRSVKAKGIKAFAGHCGKPPGVSEPSPIRHELTKNGRLSMIITRQSGTRKTRLPRRSRMAFRRGGSER